MEPVLILIIALLVLITAVLLISRHRQNKEIEKINGLVNDYLANDKPIDFSLSDKRLSALQNNISDLQNRVTVQKAYTENQIKKNTEFVLDISHQLKTPLAALRLYCEIDERENSTPHTEKQLQVIDKTEALVQNILKLEKIENDGYTMEFKPHSVNEIIKNTVREFSLIFDRKVFSINGDGILNCDEFWLREAFSNVIKNACEHTPADGVVNIKISQTERSLTVEVHDNGEGVCDEDLPNLFTRFYKAKNASAQSIGIGLAITKAITEKHHGTITAENKNNSLLITMCFPIIDGVQAV